MTLPQLGDWLAQQEKVSKVTAPAELSLDQLTDKVLECCSDQRLSRFIQKRLCDPSTDRAEKERFLDAALGPQSKVKFADLILNNFGNYVIQIILQMYPKIIHSLGLAAQEDVIQ
jgi:hypothetical protein